MLSDRVEVCHPVFEKQFLIKIASLYRRPMALCVGFDIRVKSMRLSSIIIITDDTSINRDI